MAELAKVASSRDILLGDAWCCCIWGARTCVSACISTEKVKMRAVPTHEHLVPPELREVEDTKQAESQGNWIMTGPRESA